MTFLVIICVVLSLICSYTLNQLEKKKKELLGMRNENAKLKEALKYRDITIKGEDSLTVAYNKIKSQIESGEICAAGMVALKDVVVKHPEFGEKKFNITLDFDPQDGLPFDW